MSEIVVQQTRQNQTFNQKIQALKAKGCNIIGNEVYFDDDPPLGFKYAIEVVNINPDKKFQQVYPQKGGGLSLSGLGLKIIAKAMNVRSLPGQIVYEKPTAICFRARAFIRGLDGQPVMSEKDYESNLTVKEDEFLNSYRDKALKYQAQGFPQADIPAKFKMALREDKVENWIREETRIEMIQARKHALTKAQTGAQLRCIRDLGPLQSTYTIDQLKNPFLIVKLVQHLDPNNPVDRKFALEQSKIPMMMFPSETPSTPQTRSIDAQAPALSLPEPEEASQLDELLEAPIEPVEEDLPLEQNQASPNESAMMDFDACEPSEQIANINHLIKAKDWKGNLTKTLKDFTDSERRLFFEMLVALPKAEQTSLPWS